MGRKYSWVQPKPDSWKFLASTLRLHTQLIAEYVQISCLIIFATLQKQKYFVKYSRGFYMKYHSYHIINIIALPCLKFVSAPKLSLII
jgi:hypothetical protein